MAGVNRTLLEVLKWSSPNTVLQAASVSCLWSKACNSNELWREFIEANEFTEAINPRSYRLKSAFRDAYEASVQTAVFELTKRGMYTYSCRKRAFTRFLRLSPCRCLEHSAIAYISSKAALLCGGRQHPRKAEMFSLVSAQVTPLPNMQYPRNFHAAIHYKRVVYVFGNQERSVSMTAECFHIPEHEWKKLPNMIESHSYFNACRSGQEIYLCGGLTVECEVFDTVAHTYRMLPFKLPSASWNLSFFYGNRLVSINGRDMMYLEPEGWKPRNMDLPYITIGSSSALVYDDFVYIPLKMDSGVLVINMNNLTCEQFKLPRSY